MLRTVRLRPLEGWSSKGHGLAFVLAKTGRAKHILGRATRPVGPGDVLVFEPGSRGQIGSPERRGVLFWEFCP